MQGKGGALPKIVDHDERRKAVALIVEELALEIGIEEIKVRDIAAKAGYSTNVIYHYFRTKTEMLIFAQVLARQRAVSRVQEAFHRGSSIVECLEELLPMTDEQRREWHTWFSLWGMPPRDPMVASERNEGSDEANALFSAIVAKEQNQGRLNADENPREVALSIQVIMNGIASLAASDPVKWPDDRQRAYLRKHLAGIGFRL